MSGIGVRVWHCALRSLPPVVLVLSVSGALADPQYITIAGLQPVSINKSGAITGFYDGQGLGFVMTRSGKISNFAVTGSIATLPAGINDKGVVAGTYRSGAPFLYHGFLRAADGTLTTFDAATLFKQGQGTLVTGIDNQGYITGYVYKSSRHKYGFIRDPHGKIKKIVCGRGTTTSAGINSERTTVGTCYDGYLRTKDGTFTTLTGLYPAALNDAGSVAGQAGSGGPGVGFFRTSDGTVATFDPSDGQSYGTKAKAINSGDVVVGYYHSTQDHGHGFLRTPDGTITSFDVPGSLGTFPAAINASGVIAGTYLDANDFEGFIRIP